MQSSKGDWILVGTYSGSRSLLQGSSALGSNRGDQQPTGPKPRLDQGLLPAPGVSKSRYFVISISIKYSNFNRFYKKMGPFHKKLRCDKFGN